MNRNESIPRKVLFVCLGNICRSPAAEGILQKLIQERGLGEKIFVDSAGTSDFHTGQPADARMRQAASSHGYQLLSRARTLVPKDLLEFDLVIAMDRENFRNIHSLARDDAPNVRMLSDFLGDDWPRNVPDPYYGGDEGFEFVIRMLEEACPKILVELLQMDEAK